jgi:ubiquinone/menaquinone biosynthesis C-methylase UbiE
MNNFMKQKLERLVYIFMGKDKEFAEIKFWRKQINNYVKWYNGELASLYGHASPIEGEKVKAATTELSALLTFFKLHQLVKYQKDLLLNEHDFAGLKVLDIGSGPFPSSLTFKNCETFSLDPLMDSYIAAGYPIHCYEQRARFVKSMAESMPFENGYFDAVISVNAIDHVNDFTATAVEIKRVLKPGGRFRMHVHYHPKTKAEPLELNDEIFLKHYSWVKDLKKINVSKEKIGTSITNDNEVFVVWGN